MTDLETPDTAVGTNTQKSGPSEYPGLETKLVRFGLSEGETRVYLTLLEAGRDLGGSEIARKTALHRQYVYAAIPLLREKGLVIEVPKGKQSRYRAAPEGELEKIAKRKLVETEMLVRELGAISRVGYEQDFEVIQGAEGFRKYELEISQDKGARGEEYILGGASEKFITLMGPLLSRYMRNKEKCGVQVKYLGCAAERDSYLRAIERAENQEARFLDKLPQGIAHMVIRHDSVSFYTFLNPPLIYIVKSEAVAENYRKFFLMLWEMAGKQNDNS